MTSPRSIELERRFGIRPPLPKRDPSGRFATQLRAAVEIYGRDEGIEQLAALAGVDLDEAPPAAGAGSFDQGARASVPAKAKIDPNKMLRDKANGINTI